MDQSEITIAQSPRTSSPEGFAVGSKWQAEPSRGEALALSVITSVVFVSFVSVLRNYFAQVDDFGDSSAYMAVAAAIRHWHFQGLVVKQFWGLPYAMAALSWTTGVSDRTALLMISAGSSLASIALAYRLWDGWIAGFFAILNFDWLQLSYLGGSEPLFVALLLGSFLQVRKEHWSRAALLTALATIVRPLGVFALVAVGLVLLSRRDYRKFLAALTIGLVIAILYVLPLAKYFGNPIATVSSYRSTVWLFGFPFYAIIKGTITEPAPWTNLVLSFGWIFFVSIAIVCMVKTKQFHEYGRAHPVEMLFLMPYLWCLYTYNYPHWARGNFARFAIPILPFVLLALYRWLPRDRRVLWGIGIMASVLAAASALGIVNVLGLIRQALG